jgi:hypothetical protein
MIKYYSDGIAHGTLEYRSVFPLFTMLLLQKHKMNMSLQAPACGVGANKLWFASRASGFASNGENRNTAGCIYVTTSFDSSVLATRERTGRYS